MSSWPSSKARKVLRALCKIGWCEDEGHRGGSHRLLKKSGFEPFTWAFHDNEEIGPRMLVRIAKCTGLKPEDL